MSSSNVSTYWCLFMWPFVLSTCTRHSLASSLRFIVSGRCSVYVILVWCYNDVNDVCVITLSARRGRQKICTTTICSGFILDLPFLCFPNSLDVNMFRIYAHTQGLPRWPVSICGNNSTTVRNPFIYLTSILQKVVKNRMDWRECSAVSVSCPALTPFFLSRHNSLFILVISFVEKAAIYNYISTL